jgi:hypothetical protein
VYSCRKISLQRSFLYLAEQRYEAIKALAAIGERSAIDTIEERPDTAGQNSLDLQAARLDNQKSLNTLTSLLWSPSQKPSPFGSMLAPTDSLDYCFERVRASYQSSFQNLNISNPSTNKYKANQEILKIDAKLKAELGPSPKLDVKYNFLFNTQTSEHPALSISNYRWAATFTMPLFLRSARSIAK